MTRIWRLCKEFPGLISTCIVLLWVGIAVPHNNVDPDIRSDGVGYHMWTHALLSGDFSTCKYKNMPHFGGAISYTNPEKNICQNKYPPGVALARLPFMMFATDPSKTTSINEYEHILSRLCASLCLLGIFLFMIMSLRTLEVSNQITDMSIMIGTFGTGIFHYATYDNSFSHIYSALGTSIIIWVGIKIIKEQVTPMVLGLFILTSFWLFMVRNTNIFILGIWGLATLLQSRFKAKSFMILCTGALGALLAIGVQLFYNHYTTGQLSLSSYGDESFIWNRPMFTSVLFSYQRGVFTYYPVMLLGFLGIFFGQTRSWAILYTCLILFFAAFYGYWYAWYLGGGFGHRGFVELAPFFILMTGLVLKHTPKFFFAQLSGVIFLCVSATVILMAGYWQGSLPFMSTSPHVYWQHMRLLFLLAPLVWFAFTGKSLVAKQNLKTAAE